MTAIALALVGTGVASAAPASLSAPAISGVPDYNQLLTCNPGTWSGNPVKFGFTWTSGETGYVKPDGALTISADTSGRARYAILYYPSSNLYQQLTVQTRPLLVPN